MSGSIEAAQSPADLVVVGGGVIGLFTAISAAEAGHSVSLVDQFEVPNVYGSSHGDSRIYRMAYNESVYLDMMALSLPKWQKLHAIAPEKLLTETGCLSIAYGASLDASKPLSALRDAYVERGLSHAVLDSEAVAKRFPQFRLPAGMCAVFVEDGGILFADRCLSAALSRARALGVVVNTGFRAIQLELTESDEEPLKLVGEDGRTVRARRCVLAPGAWLEPMARHLLGLDVPTVTSEETVNYYAPRDGRRLDEFDAFSGMPTFIAFLEDAPTEDLDDNDEPPADIYGIPSAVVPGVKVAAHFCGPLLDDNDADLRAEEMQREEESGEDTGNTGWARRPGRAERVARSVATANKFVRDCIPDLVSEPIKSVNCLYTRTMDSHFVVDVAPGTGGRVVLAGGGSGHAFKMGPALGDCAVALAFGEEPPVDITGLKLDRLCGNGQETGKDEYTRSQFR